MKIKRIIVKILSVDDKGNITDIDLLENEWAVATIDESKATKKPNFPTLIYNPNTKETKKLVIIKYLNKNGELPHIKGNFTGFFCKDILYVEDTIPAWEGKLKAHNIEEAKKEMEKICEEKGITGKIAWEE